MHEETGLPGTRPAAIGSLLLLFREPDLGTTYLRFFRHLGFDPWLSHGGAEVLSQIDREPPEVIVAEAPLPGRVDGLSVLQHLRERRRVIPVVLCARRAVDLPRREAIAAGAAGYLVAPCSLSDLRRAVADVLDRPPSGLGPLHV
jgi:CheY-like chemotaxis protein